MSPSIFPTDTADLIPLPIDPDWIYAGTPTARGTVVSRTPDGQAYTWFWECTEGVFKWRYHQNETLVILSGTVIFNRRMPTERRATAGDIVSFKAGDEVVWHITETVRKVAFVHRPLPPLIVFGAKVLRRVRGRR